MRSRSSVLCVVLVSFFLLAACGSSNEGTPSVNSNESDTPEVTPKSETPAPSGTAGSSLSSPVPTASGPPQAGKINVLVMYDEDGPRYDEGSVAFARVTRGERVVFDERMQDGKCPDGASCPRLSKDLDPGRYTLTSYQRPCDATCGTLDPPTDQCSGDFEMTRDHGVFAQVHVRAGSGCTMEFV